MTACSASCTLSEARTSHHRWPIVLYIFLQCSCLHTQVICSIYTCQEGVVVGYMPYIMLDDYTISQRHHDISQMSHMYGINAGNANGMSNM